MHNWKSNVVQILDSNYRERLCDLSDTSIPGVNGNGVLLPLPTLKSRFAKIVHSSEGKLFNNGNSATSSEDEKLNELVLSLSTNHADVDFESLRPKHIKFRELIRDFMNYSPKSNIHPAVSSSSTPDFILSNFSDSAPKFIMPFKDLRFVKIQGKTTPQLDFDRNILIHLIDGFGFKKILKSASKKLAKKINAECNKRVQFVERTHADLLLAANHENSVRIIFIDYDKYDWLQRDGHLIDAEDFVHLDSEFWDVKNKSGRFTLIRRS